MYFENSIDERKLTSTSFASRKFPEYMSYRLLRCSKCEAVFANESPSEAVIHVAYQSADYGSAIEAKYAAETYGRYLAPALEKLSRKNIAREIGTGTGIFLRYLKQFGFHQQIGIEPSETAIDFAEPDVKPKIRQGIFQENDFLPDSISLICCFQTIEHLLYPVEFVQGAFNLLEPGGMLAIIAHNYAAPINKILGRRSPIIDIEHLQIFNPISLKTLVCSKGFVTPEISSIKNTYPLRYWIKLTPLPSGVKRLILKVASQSYFGNLAISVDVGNMFLTCTKPFSSAS